MKCTKEQCERTAAAHLAEVERKHKEEITELKARYNYSLSILNALKTFRKNLWNDSCWMQYSNHAVFFIIILCLVDRLKDLIDDFQRQKDEKDEYENRFIVSSTNYLTNELNSSY